MRDQYVQGAVADAAVGRQARSSEDKGVPGRRQGPRQDQIGSIPYAWISPRSGQSNLGHLLPSEQSQLLTNGSARSVAAGTLVARAGEHVTEVHVVVRGELELKAHANGTRVTMAVVRSGGVIGDIPLLIDAPMPYDAVASRDTDLIALSAGVWTQLLTSSPSLSLRWMSSIARRLDDDRRRLVMITCKPLVAQVAYLLVTMCETDDDGSPVVKLSHTTMAHLLGARRQSVSRVVGHLREQGLVHTRYGATVLVDPAGLRRVMGDEPLPSHAFSDSEMPP